MLDNEGFDHWSGEYDKDVLEMQHKGYPFEGYYNTLGYIQNRVICGKAREILEIGIGTGLLTETLYRKGVEITGIDFSAKMLDLAQEKMPDGRFLKFDFNEGLPKELEEEKFDYIISSYAIHHICDGQKIDFFKWLIRNLKDGGLLLIGDIAFETKAAMNRVREQSTGWDETEHYMVAEEIIKELAKHQLKSEFVKTSNCSGVLVVQGQ